MKSLTAILCPLKGNHKLRIHCVGVNYKHADPLYLLI